MTGAAQYDVMRALYGPRSEDLRRSLLGRSDGLSTELHGLYTRAGAVSADQVAANLDGAGGAVLRDAEILRRDGGQ